MTTEQVRPETGGRLRAELLVLDDVGPAKRSRHRAPVGTSLLWLAPVLGMLGLMLAWPATKVVQQSFRGPGRAFAGWDNYVSAFADPQLRTDLVNTGIWAVAVPVLVTALGYLLSVLSRRAPAANVFTFVLTPMALPLVVTGVAFRLLYDPSPRVGPATALLRTVAGRLGFDPDSVPPLLGPKLVTGALISAFVWAWIGLAVVVFRQALDQIPPELEDAARAEGADAWRVLRDVQWPFLRRVAAILVLLLAVAASVTFDLVVVMVPGSVQDRAEVLSLYLLRQPLVEASGDAAAVGVVWIVVVAIGAMLAARGARHDWPSPLPTVADRPPSVPWWRRSQRTWSLPRPGRAAAVARWSRRVVLVLIAVLWAFPVVLLVLTSLHGPEDAATRSWLAPLSLGSYHDLLDSPLSSALLPTAVMALGVTVVVVVSASLAAYSLAWLHPPGEALATPLLVIAAVIPIQTIARPLHDVLSPIGLQWPALTLVLVHVGRGIPFAVLVLRNAFAAVPADLVRRRRLRANTEIGVLARVVIPAARPAIIAVAALEFMLVWNDLVVGLQFGGPGFTPVGMVLLSPGRQFITSAGQLAAGSMVASLLPLLIVLLARRSIVTGLVSGVGRRAGGRG